MHKGKTLFKNTQCEVIDCRSCGFVHVNPLPKQTELDDFYEKRFYQNEKKSYFSDYERDESWWQINYEGLLKTMLGMSGKGSGKAKPYSLLDIGSGPGLFLKVAENLGIESVGIEPSAEAHKYSRKRHGCDVVNTTLEEFSPNRKFDFIHSSLVLEHVLDPKAFVSKSVKMLNRGGLLCIIVPNDFNPIQKINLQLGKSEWWVSPFEHLNYFNGKSLKKLLKRAGLNIVHESVTFPIDLFLLMGVDYITNSEVGKQCHEMRKTLEYNLHKTNNHEFQTRLYKSFFQAGIGRELVIIGKKK